MTSHICFNIVSLPFFIAAVLLLSLSVYHITKKTPVSLAFGWLNLISFVWLAGLAWEGFMPSSSLGSRIYFIGVALIPPFFNLATRRFLNSPSRQIQAEFLIAVILSALIVVLDMLHPDFITHSRVTSLGVIRRFGWPGWLLIVYLIVAAIYNYSIWVRAYLHEKEPVHRRRILIIGAGFLLMGLAFADFLRDLGLTVYPMGATVMTFLMFFESYALYIYDVSRIESFLSSLGCSLLTFALLALPWVLVFSMLDSWLQHLSRHELFFIHLLIFGLVLPYGYFGIPWVRNRLLKKEIQYQRIINDFLGQIYYLKNPNKLVQYLNTMIRKTSANPIKFILRNMGRHHYYLWKNDYTHDPLHSGIQELLPWLEQNPEILLKYDAVNNPEMGAMREILARAFKTLEAQILIPLIQNDELLGMICIGEKSNGQPPLPLEMEFYRKMQSIASLALNNAYLYDHIRRLSRELWDTNVTLHEKVKEKTQALENALAYMKKMNEEQRDFFTMASHNLKTPLTSIKISSTLLWSKMEEKKNMGIYAILQSNVKRLEALIADIIEIVRAEHGRLELNPSRIDVPHLIHEIQQEMAWIYSDKAIEWSFAIAENIPCIWADSERLKTVFLNLFSNACKFTSTGGRVHFSMKAADVNDLEKYEELEVREGQAYFEFSIQDSGDGIPQEEQKVIFEIFKQVSRSHRRYQGNGLGLYLVKKIIQNHGGAITLVSRWGEGSVFSFVLPEGQPRPEN